MDVRKEYFRFYIYSIQNSKEDEHLATFMQLSNKFGLMIALGIQQLLELCLSSVPMRVPLSQMQIEVAGRYLHLETTTVTSFLI